MLTVNTRVVPVPRLFESFFWRLGRFLALLPPLRRAVGLLAALASTTISVFELPGLLAYFLRTITLDPLASLLGSVLTLLLTLGLAWIWQLALCARRSTRALGKRFVVADIEDTRNPRTNFDK
jgi:uncharacterized RDD family membrane protein YckC